MFNCFFPVTLNCLIADDFMWAINGKNVDSPVRRHTWFMHIFAQHSQLHERGNLA